MTSFFSGVTFAVNNTGLTDEDLNIANKLGSCDRKKVSEALDAMLINQDSLLFFKEMIPIQLYWVGRKDEAVFWLELYLLRKRQEIELRNLDLEKNDMALLEHSFAGKVIPPSIKSDEISCLVNLPQYRLWGTVNSFELMSKIGLGLGFTPSGGISAGGMIGVNFEVDTYQLDMNLVAGHPITL